MFVGIDHSVNKSAVCVIDEKGNLLGAALFEKNKSSHKYTFSYYNKDQVKVKEVNIDARPQTDKIISKNKKQLIKTEDNKITNTSYLYLDDSQLYDEGEYTRTVLICENLLEYLKSFNNKDMKITIEGYAFFAPGNIALIAENVGYMKILLLKERWKFKFAQPNSIKKEITGMGISGKEATELALVEKYGINFHNDDLNDSFAIAEYSRITYNRESSKAS